MTSKQQATTITEAAVLKALPVRKAGAHKWGVGGLVILAGSQTYLGAAALAAMSAGRAGAGIVSVAIPRGAIGVVATLVPEAVFIPLRDGEPAPAARAAIEAIKPKLERSKALLIGPGLGDDDHTEALLSAIFGIGAVARPASVGFHRRESEPETSDSSESLLSSERPTVVDADALNWLAKRAGWHERVSAGSLVLTPHAGEMARLLDISVDDVLADPVQIAVDAAKRWKQVVVLKVGATVATDGATTVIADDAPESLATAGSGDIFSGFIAGMLAQGVAPLDAASIAIYAGTRAARALEARFGVRGLVASDLPIAMAEVISSLDA